MTNEYMLSAEDTAQCPECGALVVGGRAGCEALFDQIRFAATTDFRIGAVHALAFDAYCMQHPATYCISAKSYAAHLTRLCCGVERNGDAATYAAINRWLNGNVSLQKPAILSERGTLTIARVVAAPDVETRVAYIQNWASDVWAAYASQHDLARKWIETAFARQWEQ